MAFAGDPHALSGDWLLCDGTALKAIDFPDLFRAIGTTHGAGVDANGAKVPGEDFNLPDYRGVFLRGVDLDVNGVPSGRDDRPGTTRTFARGGTGNTGNAVGSFQNDQLQSHKHNDTGHTHSTNATRPTGQVDSDNSDEKAAPPNPPPASVGEGHANLTDPVASSAGEVRHGPETRPRNVAVWWIIRARP
jgi:microcystin-dependent protein